MKQKIRSTVLLLLCLSMLTLFCSCHSQNEYNSQSSADGIGGDSITSEIKNDLPADSKILIAYFSWADNTVSEQGVDAVASASVTVPGNTAVMAQWIKAQTGGELYPITVGNPYPYDYDECLNRAADEKAAKARPTLQNAIENFDDYDVIFLGFPNWCYTAPMAVFSFIEQYDFNGKTVIPFCSHGTGGVASSVKDITAALPSSTKILPVIGINRDDIDNAETQINTWLDSFGLRRTENAD